MSEYSYENGRISRIDWSGFTREVLEINVDYSLFKYDGLGRLITIEDFYEEESSSL